MLNGILRRDKECGDAGGLVFYKCCECLKWMKACGRDRFSVENITKDTYICSLHSVGSKGPTEHHPDPIPVLASETEKEILNRKTVRRPPVERATLTVTPKEDEPGARGYC